MKEFPNLDNLSIAAPCNADWESMTGDERKRLCGLCNKNVYNISKLSKTEAEDLLGKNKDLCVQFFRRQDGTILTANCPVGLRKIKEGVKRLSHFVAYALAFIITIATGAKAEAKGSKITLTGGVSYDVYPVEPPVHSGIRGRAITGAVLEKPSTKDSGKGQSNKNSKNEKKQIH